MSSRTEELVTGFAGSRLVLHDGVQNSRQDGIKMKWGRAWELQLDPRIAEIIQYVRCSV